MTIAIKITLSTSVDGSTKLPTAGLTATEDADGIFVVKENGADIATLGLIDLRALVQLTTPGVLAQPEDYLILRGFCVDSNVGGVMLANAANQDGNAISTQLSLPAAGPGASNFGYENLAIYKGELFQVDQAAPQGPLVVAFMLEPLDSNLSLCCVAQGTGGGGGPS